MKLYEYAPKKNPTRISGVVIILISLSVALFLTPAVFGNIPFRGLFQFAGMVSLVAVIYVITRYIARDYVYTLVENGERTVDMTVTEVMNGGKRSNTVCRIGVNNISEAYLLRPEDPNDAAKLKALAARARAEQIKLFNYVHDMKASPVCAIFVEECGEKLYIRISCDDVLFDAIKPALGRESEESGESGEVEE